MNTQKNVAVLIYEGVELVDMNGPIDAFLHANDYNGHRYSVFTVAETAGELRGEGNTLAMRADHTLADSPRPDILVIPGQILKRGNPSTFGQGSDALIQWIKDLALDGKPVTIMSVCVGSFILARTGLLNGRKATTHYLALGDMGKMYPDITMIRNVRFVQDEQFITTGGVTSGIDGALHLVEQLDGPAIAQQTADVLVYNREGQLPPFTLLPPYENA